MKQKKAKNEMIQRRHRLVVVSFSAVVVLLSIGLGLAMYRPSVVRVQGQPDAFALTATALIGKITQDAQSVIMTQEAQGMVTVTSSPSGYRPIGSPDAFQLTMTKLIGEVTQQAVYLTDVANGDVTLVPFDDVVKKWIIEVEEEVGFSHPELETIVEELLLKYKQDLTTVQFAQIYTNIGSYDADDYSYVAVLIQSQASERKFDWDKLDEELLVFLQMDESLDLIYRRSIGFGNFLSLLADYNNNGLVNLAIEYQANGDCRYSRVMILELSGDQVLDISPIMSEQPNGLYSFFGLVDVDDELILDVVYDSYGDATHETCETLEERITYQWNGERYAKID